MNTQGARARRPGVGRREQERLARERREAERRARRRRILWAGAGAALVAIAATVGVLVASGSSGPAPATHGSGRTATVKTAPFSPAVPVTLSDAPPPWPLPADATLFIAAAGLQPRSSEVTTVHYHAHVDVIVNGSAVTVPAELGFVIRNGNAVGLTSLHTHDTSGIVHIEAPADEVFTLGQVFTEWGVRLGSGQLGGLTSGTGSTLRIFVDGHEFAGDPATIVLRSHEEIALWYGPAGSTPNVPASYHFPQGL